MSSGYWVGDAIATNLERQSDAARAASEMKRQQSYYAGAYVTRRLALQALQEANPDHPMNTPAVVVELEARTEAVFSLVGLERACDLELDPHLIHQELLQAFEKRRSALVQKLMAIPIKKRRAGWWWARRDVWRWRGCDAPSEHDAKALQTSEIQRLAKAKLGDRL